MACVVHEPYTWTFISRGVAMALVEGIHILARGDKAEARRIAMDIEAYQRLLIGTWSFYGAGAYYVDTLFKTQVDV